MEPGLALMDEIGRRALTDAFIRFTKQTARTHRFLYNPNADEPNNLGSPIEAGAQGASAQAEDSAGQQASERSAAERAQHAGDLDDLDEDDSPTLPKCPSAPNIHHHKLYPATAVPSMLVTPAEGSEVNSKNRNNKKKSSSILRNATGDSSPQTRPASQTSRVKLSLSPLQPPSFEEQDGGSKYDYFFSTT